MLPPFPEVEVEPELVVDDIDIDDVDAVDCVDCVEPPSPPVDSVVVVVVVSLEVLSVSSVVEVLEVLCPASVCFAVISEQTSAGSAQVTEPPPPCIVKV